MKISVVIPTYNVEKYLRQALSSVVNQSYRNLDIVCVDDGSTDNSLLIIKEYAAQDNRIQVITQENQGTYIARQVGVDKKKQQVGIEEQHRCIEQQQVHIESLQSQLNRVSEKNKKHLKQIRTLAVIIGLMVLGLIVSVII